MIEQPTGGNVPTRVTRTSNQREAAFPYVLVKGMPGHVWPGVNAYVELTVACEVPDAKGRYISHTLYSVFEPEDAEALAASLIEWAHYVREKTKELEVSDAS